MEFFVYTGGNQKVPLDVEKVRIAESCKKIEDKAFIGRKVKTILCKEGLEEIGDSAFEDCESLEAFEAPSTLLKIGNRAFANCIRLRRLKLNEGLEEIRKEAFLKCRCIKFLCIPTTVTKLLSKAFEGCRQLLEVVLGPELAKQKDIYSDTFKNCNKLRVIVKPENLKLSDGAVSETAKKDLMVLPYNDENSQKVYQQLEEEIAKFKKHAPIEEEKVVVDQKPSSHDEIAALKEELRKVTEERNALDDESKRVAEEGKAIAAKLKQAEEERDMLVEENQRIQECEAKISGQKSDLEGKLQVAVNEKDSLKETNSTLRQEKAVAEAKLEMATEASQKEKARTEALLAEFKAKLEEKETKELKDAEERGGLREKIHRLSADLEQQKPDTVLSDERSVEQFVFPSTGMAVSSVDGKIEEVTPIKTEVVESSTDSGEGLDESRSAQKRKMASHQQPESTQNLADPATRDGLENLGRNKRRSSRRLRDLHSGSSSNNII